MIAFGCLGCGGFLAVVAILAVALNWGTIQETYYSAKEDISEVLAVRAALVEELDGASVQVSANHEFGSDARTLQIEISGLDLGEEDPAERAHEIAVLAAHVHPAPDKFTKVSIRFVKSTSGVIRFSTSEHHDFAMEELLAEEPPSPR